MAKIILKQVTGEGFGSFVEPFSFALDRGGINLVKGSNGNGKTTLFSTVCWAWFGINLKGVVKDKVASWPWIRTENFRGTRVSLRFEVDGQNYMIARHIKFKGTTKGIKANDALMIFRVNGEDYELIGEQQHKGDQQAWINRLLGFSPKTFLNAVLFGQRMSRLIRASNDEKRKLFEEIFDVEFVEQAKNAAKEDFDKKKIERSGYETKAEGKQTLIDTKNEHYTSMETLLADFNTQKKNKVTIAKGKYDAVAAIERGQKTKLDDAEKLAAKFDSAELTKLEKQKEQYDADLEAAEEEQEEHFEQLTNLKKEIEKAEMKETAAKKAHDELSTTCPVCEGPLKKEKIADARKNLKDAWARETKVVSTLKKDLKAAQLKTQGYADTCVAAKAGSDLAAEQIEELLEKNAEYKKAADSIPVLNAEYVAAQKNTTREKEAWDAEKAAEPPKVDLKKLKSEIETLESERDELDKKAAEALIEEKHLQWWVQTGFGSGGLKSFVFNAMLTQLNASIEKYTARAGLRVHFSIDMTKASKPFVTTLYRDGQEIDYDELSGGQGQRIDVCLAFAMFDVLGFKADVNLLIMDEIFEGLDEEGIEMVFDFIRMKAATGKTLFIITHSKLIDSMNCKTVWIGYENERSFVEEEAA